MDDKIIKEKIESAPSILEWNVLIPYDNKWKAKSIVTGIIFLIFLGYFIYFDYNEFYWGDFIVFSSLMIFCPWLSYYVFFADFSYSYKLTKYGCVCTHYQKIPKIMYHIGYVVAVMGGFVAILGAIVAGPSAFLGGGIFLLVGLFSGNMNMMPEPKKDYYYLLGGVIHIFFPTREDISFLMMSEPFEWKRYDAIHVTPENRDEVIEKIIKIATNAEVYEVGVFTDAFLHPRYKGIMERRKAEG